MTFQNYVIVKHNRPFYRPVIAISHCDRKVTLGQPSDDGLSFSLEEAQSIAKMLRIAGYDVLVWSRKD